jgi:dihydroflavonol-4-reductase
MSDRSDRVLVTGASGFIGGAIARLLQEKGFIVRAFVRPTSSRVNINPQYELAEGDVTDPASVRAALKNVRFLFHAAADYRLWARDPQTVTHINVEGTRVVMREALRAGVERIVHTSSVATLDAGIPGLCDETRRKPVEKAVGAYKRSKIISEGLVEDLVENEGLPAVIVNPSAPIGPGDVRPTPTGRIIVEALRGRVPAYVETGLDIVHVDDVAQGHLAALMHGGIGERYILGGENVKLSTLLAELAQLVGRPAPRIRLPRAPLVPLAFAAEAVATITRREPFLNRESLRLAATPMFFDDSKARRELGYRPRPYREALEDGVRWFRDLEKSAARRVHPLQGLAPKRTPRD